MRNTAMALLLAGLGALWLAGAPAGAGDLAGDIRRTADQLLLGGSHEPGDVFEALRRLVATSRPGSSR